MEVIDRERPEGVIVQYGGQTPLKLCRALEEAGAPIIGTTPESIDVAEDRERFQKLVTQLGLRQPANATARTEEAAINLARDVGYPLVVRPSYVLGGRAMEIVFNEDDLKQYMTDAVKVSNQSPVLLDRFLDDAIEVDVDAVCDGKAVLIGGIMEHVEQAGVHSGDSGCSLPPHSLSAAIQDAIREQTRKLALALKVVGLMNIQFAIQKGVIFVLEVNPRASRTAPFVSKATGLQLAKIGARVMTGRSLASMGLTVEKIPDFYSVKEAVFPFGKFPEADPLLGPEMKSTGEVMGTGRSFGEAYAKAQSASGVVLPRAGLCLISVKERDKPGAVDLARKLVDRGFELVATHGTAQVITDAGIPCRRVNKVRDGRPHCVDMIKNDEIVIIVNTTEGKQAVRESHSIRREAVQRRVTYYTTLAAALATCEALDSLDEVGVNRLQDLHGRPRRRSRAHETLSDDRPRRRAAARGAQEAEVRGPSERDQGDRRGAQPRRSVRERRVPRGARAAGLHRGADQRDRGQALDRRRHRRDPADAGRQGGVRRDRRTGGRGRRQARHLHDRRRGRGRHQGGPHRHHLADRAGAGRQVQGRRRRRRPRPAGIRSYEIVGGPLRVSGRAGRPIAARRRAQASGMTIFASFGFRR